MNRTHNSSSMRATVIIQARMSSTRLPGKIMLEVMGEPLIGHMVARLKHCKRIDDIIVATSDDESNDKMCEYLYRRNVKIFRGSEEDVLERFYKAAKKYAINNIVRLTADCPLIDPQIVDKYISKFFIEDLDYIYPKPTFAEGLDTEVFTFESLEKAYKNARMRSEREHVTLYFHNNPHLFNSLKLKNCTDDSKYRITIDEPEDFEVVKKIIEALYTNENNPFGIEEIKDFLDKNPEIYRINADVIRNEGLIKSLEKDFEI